MSLNPLHDDPRLASAVRQQDIFSDLHDKPLALRGIPWERTGTRRGFIESQDIERQALVNDFEYHRIPIQIRLADLDALRALYKDADLAELTVMGPGRQSAAYPGMAVADEPYTITGEWQDFPAFFANWLNYRCAEDPALGAPYSKAIKTRSTDDNGEESVRYRHEPQPGTRLFRWRTPADIASGERPSGLVVPNSFDPFAGGDDEEQAAPVAPVATAPRKGK